MKAILRAALAAAISGAVVGYMLKKRLYEARLGRAWSGPAAHRDLTAIDPDRAGSPRGGPVL